MPNYKQSECLHPVKRDAPGCISLIHIVDILNFLKNFFFCFLRWSRFFIKQQLIVLQSLIIPEMWL